MTKWFVRVSCDWEAEGLWDEQGAMYPLDQMPLSAPLKQRIREWQERFSARQPWEPWQDSEFDAHRSEAIAIARQVKAELPHVDVVALDRRILADGSLGDCVPYPGEHLLKR